MKRCYKCKIEKYYIEFSKDKTRKDGYALKCRGCQKEYDKQRRIDNLDKLRQQSKQSYLDNPEKKRQYNKQHYIKHAEHIKQSGKLYAQTPHGKLMLKTKNHKRRVSLRDNTPSGKHFTANDLILKLKLQKGKCVYCQVSIRDYYEIDHIIPASKSGSNEAWNIQLLCKDCNGSGGKGSKLSHEFAQKHGMLV